MPERDPLPTLDHGVPVRAAHSVERPRLRALLEGATGARLVLVAAPAGFGKSTLLADWLRSAGLRTAWLALAPRDNDPVRFARSLAVAAARLAGRDDVTVLADRSHRFDVDVECEAILGLLMEGDGGPRGHAMVVLDDYHVITEAAVHGLVASLVERLPRGTSLAIATRADPPLRLARLRARGELAEVRAADLRFTATEAAELLRSAAVELATSEIQELTERTEGWAAVLRLAAISLRDRPDQEDRVRRFGASHRFVLDYIVEEVLGGLPPATERFLLRTSLLDRLCGPLCDAVTGDADGQERLEELDRANLLVVPLDDERRWYRYHALFAEVLRARLGMLHPGEAPGLHVRAAAWHAARGDDDEAVDHAIRSGDLDLATRLLGEASLRRLNAGELRTVRQWLDALPDAAVRRDAQLSASYAWCLVLPGETAGVAARLADADDALARDAAADPTAAAVVRAQLALIRSRLADLEGDFATAIAQAHLARDLIPAGLPLAGEATLRGDATILLARALVGAGDAAGAAAAYEASLPDLRTGGNLFALARAVADLASLALDRGDPGEAIRRCEAELELTPASAAPASGAVWAALARARLTLGDTDHARSAAGRALDLATRSGDAQVVRSARRTLERLELAAPGAATVSPRRPGAAPGLVEPLTAREIEVLRLVALGRSNSQIARELFVSVGTVKSHVHAIAGKLGAANRVESVARGRALAILD